MTNEEVKRRPGMASLHYIVISRRRRLAGHMLCLPRDRLARVCMW